MLYTDIIRKLFNLNLFGGMKLGLQNAHALQQHLNFPDRSFASIHIAGTNGKGSVATKIACAFQHAGYRVGLYTSPHLACFRERIRLNGEMIPEEATVTLLMTLFELMDKERIPATFFEVTTFLALLYFAQEKADVVVLETGLGGRLDATNIVHPCLSVITSISLDHTDLLGKTREEIAHEKAGIIKSQIPVVIGPHVPLKSIQEVAKPLQSQIIQAQSTSTFFEEENQKIARTALEWLSGSFSLSSNAISQGLKGRQPCRFEVLEGTPLIILDVSHNPDGFVHLFQAIQQHYPGKAMRLLFGLSKNKDVQGCLRLIAQHGHHFHLVEAPNGRGVPLEELETLLQHFIRDSSLIFKHSSIAEGIHLAREQAIQHQEILVICGSFFIMGQARQALGFEETQDLIDLNEQLVAIKSI